MCGQPREARKEKARDKLVHVWQARGDSQWKTWDKPVHIWQTSGGGAARVKPGTDVTYFGT